MDYLSNYYKNLCEQLQEKVNYLEKLLNESEPDPRAESWDRHSDIVDSIINHHVFRSRYKPATKDITAVHDVTVKTIKNILDKHPEAPFRNPGPAIQAIRAHVIDGSDGVSDRVVNREGKNIRNIVDRGEYKDVLQKTAEDYSAELEDKVNEHVGVIKDD
jgi:hypothetical protein